MKQKELDMLLDCALTDYFHNLSFKGRGKGTSRCWERKFDSDKLHVIVTPCAPVRTGGAAVSCGAAIRFNKIETELAQLTEGSNCFSPSRETCTIGSTLEELVRPSDGLLRWELSDEMSVKRACLELEPLLTSFALPWFEEMQTYTSAYHYLLQILTDQPKRGCVTAFRAFLLGRHIGADLHEVVLRSLERTIAEDDIGADVCRRILNSGSQPPRP
jgi:hypothetical protein